MRRRRAEVHRNCLAGVTEIDCAVSNLLHAQENVSIRRWQLHRGGFGNNRAVDNRDRWATERDRADMEHVGGNDWWRRGRHNRGRQTSNRARHADLTMKLSDQITGTANYESSKQRHTGEKTQLADADKGCESFAFGASKEKHSVYLAGPVPLIVYIAEHQRAQGC